MIDNVFSIFQLKELQSQNKSLKDASEERESVNQKEVSSNLLDKAGVLKFRKL